MMRRLILAFALCLAAAPAFAARIKDISVLRSARDTQLVGYGLVVGLQGSGDTLRNAPFTEQSVQAMLTHLGLDVHGAALRNRNVASVIVTADLSAGVETASRLDVTPAGVQGSDRAEPRSRRAWPHPLRHPRRSPDARGGG